MPFRSDVGSIPDTDKKSNRFSRLLSPPPQYLLKQVVLYRYSFNRTPPHATPPPRTRSIIALAFSILLVTVPQATQAALYAPGATLDPACAPSDSNCGVITNVGTGTQGQVPYYAAGGNLLSATSTFQILANGTASTTSLIVSNSFSFGTLSGFLKATAGAIATSLINLASDVTGILPVSNGGTGVSAIANGFIPFGNGTGAVATSSSLYFDSTNGRLGIGTTSPGEKLEVNGNIKLGNATISGGGTRNFVVHSEYNVIENGTYSNTISGGGSSTALNLIGTTSLPYYNDFTPTNWSADTGYVAESASVATISGGYDNIVNQLAGTIAGGGHNFIKYNIDGHSVIGGGSYNLISAGRSGIFSGRRNTITGNKNFSFIGGGDDNNIVGNYSAIPGGLSNAVGGDYSFAFGLRAKANANGVMALSDSTDADFTVSTANVFGARYSGGYWLTGGNVGIGTASLPTNILQIESASNTTFLASAINDGTHTIRLKNSSDTNNAYTGIMFVHRTSGVARSGIFSVSPSANNDDLVFVTEGSDVIGEKFRITSTGNVGIGTTSPYALLSISNSRTTTANTPLFAVASTTNGTATTTVFSIASSGDVTVNGSSGSTCTIGNSTGATMCSSDERLKTNIALIIDPLKSIEQLRGVTFNWADTTKNQQQFIGVIAQDVQKVFPQAVATLSNGYLAVDYGALVAPLIEAVKELAGKVSALASTVAGFGQKFTTNELCVGSTCVDETQLKTLLQNSGQQSAPPPTSPEASQGTAQSGAGAGDTQAATTTDPVATSTPDVPPPPPDPAPADTASTTPITE